MTDFLLAIVVCAIPVLGIVVLAMSGRVLRKTCATGPRGDCQRCGRSDREPPAADGATSHRTGSKVGSCPADQATHG
jgi:hypothetical protein